MRLRDLVLSMKFRDRGQEQRVLSLDRSRVRNETGVEHDVASTELDGTAAHQQVVVFVHGQLIASVQAILDSQRVHALLGVPRDHATEELGTAAGPVGETANSL